MNRWRILWRVLTGQDAKTLRDHSAVLAEHERRINSLERLHEARAAFRHVAGGGGK
ncbi:hypothetical protein [Novosphingobium sp. M1R2S20]|uniref:Uncharacterized protein n=1 Tax=Novosphingobium rhizovicinum TaxID=3228928 RepID=A0ABV3RFB8_9SPHN